MEYGTTNHCINAPIPNTAKLQNSPLVKCDHVTYVHVHEFSRKQSLRIHQTNLGSQCIHELGILDLKGNKQTLLGEILNKSHEANIGNHEADNTSFVSAQVQIQQTQKEATVLSGT